MIGIIASGKYLGGIINVKNSNIFSHLALKRKPLKNGVNFHNLIKVNHSEGVACL